MSRVSIRTLILGLMMLTACIGGTAEARPDKPYEVEAEGPGPLGSLFMRTAATPEEQLVLADERWDAGQFRRAGKRYRTLVKKWPHSSSAAAAQLGYAKSLERRGKHRDAFDEYQYLIERYTGQFDYDDVLERQFRIANYLMTNRKAKFLIFPGFEAPERAIPLFEQIVENAPRWERSAEAQYLIGHAYELTKQYELAITAYMTAQFRYPSSPFAEKASFARAHCVYQISKENLYDEESLESAWAALTHFLNQYPNSEQVGIAKLYRENLFKRRTKLAYDEARFYDEIAKKPKAALIAYKAFLRDFPNSEWTIYAENRIEALTEQTQN